MKGLLRKVPGKLSETAIDDEIVVMSLDSGDFFSLTGTGRSAWLLIDGSRDRAALIAALATEYAADAALIAPEIEAFLDELGAAGLIESG